MKILYSILAICLIGVATACSNASEDHLRSAFLGPDRWDDEIDLETAQLELRAHFAQVIEILQKDGEKSLRTALRNIESNLTSALSEADRAKLRTRLRNSRATQIGRLRKYARKGRFPRNEGHAKSAVPIFVDQSGTHCAVGHLMSKDGRNTQVAEIVETSNLRLVSEMRTKGLDEWLESSGLTAEEAALIQPGYPPSPLHVTLEEMQSTMPTLTREGYTVSRLTVSMASYIGLSQFDLFNTPWDLGIAMFDGFELVSPVIGEIVPLPDPGPRRFGLHLNSGEFHNDDCGVVCSWTPNIEDWMYLGGAYPFPTRSLHNTIMLKIDYEIESHNGPFSEFGLTSSHRTTSNSVGPESDQIRIASFIYDNSTDVLVGELNLQTEPTDRFLSGFESTNIDGQSLRVTTFAMAQGTGYEIEPTQFRSFFHEFRSVPEPNSTLLLLFAFFATITARQSKRFR